MICRNCNKIGHLARTCRERHHHDRRSDHPQYRDQRRYNDGRNNRDSANFLSGRSNHKNNNRTHDNNENRQNVSRSNLNQNIPVNNFAGAFTATMNDVALSTVYTNAISLLGKRLGTTAVEDIWLANSGASCHISFHREWFCDFRPTNSNISVGGNGLHEVKGIGTILIKRLVNGIWYDGRIENVLYVPNFKKNLFSTNVCTANGIRVIFDDDDVYLQMKETDEIVAEGIRCYRNICALFMKSSIDLADDVDANISMKKLHETISHVNRRTLKQIVNNKSIEGVDHVCDDDFFCESCQFGKLHRLPRKHKEKTIEFKVGECIYVDLCGPMSLSLGKAKYFMLLRRGWSQIS